MNDDTGQIRVGRCIFSSTAKGGYIFPEYPGFIPIVVLTKSSAYGSLGPYCLKDENGRIMENIWQFSKVYPYVPEVRVPYTARNPKIVWTWQKEAHINELIDVMLPLEIDPMLATPNEDYWKWRDAGMHNSEPVRYPVGRNFAKECLYSLRSRGEAPLNYVEARQQIYLPIYSALVQHQDDYGLLWDRLQNGENLLIIETDGPHQESLEYYRKKYDVAADFIENETILATPKNLKIMLEDTKHAFGHGYCLAAALLGYDKSL
jgi:hypothetical protein